MGKKLVVQIDCSGAEFGRNPSFFAAQILKILASRIESNPMLFDTKIMGRGGAQLGEAKWTTEGGPVAQVTSITVG